MDTFRCLGLLTLTFQAVMDQLKIMVIISLCANITGYPLGTARSKKVSTVKLPSYVYILHILDKFH